AMKLRPAHSLLAVIGSIATQISLCRPAVVTLLILGSPAMVAAGVTDTPCPPGAIAVEPGASVQTAVDSAGEGAAFCLKSGVHRVQARRPPPGQRLHRQAGPLP